jgi:peptidoglycan/LPS O-acetylase OafA/YrhL
MGVVAIFAVSCMAKGSWNLFCFSSGMLIADFNLGQEEDGRTPPARHSMLWNVVFAIAFYVAGFPTLTYPESRVNPMPGFETLRSLIPMSLNMEDHARWWWSISGVAMLFCISQLPRLKSIFETNFCHYIGKISFCLYLLHEFCLVLFGLTMRDILMRIAGLGPESTGLLYWLVCGIWFVMFTIPLFALAAQAQRWVDVPSVRFAQWLEGECIKVYKNVR